MPVKRFKNGGLEGGDGVDVERVAELGGDKDEEVMKKDGEVKKEEVEDEEEDEEEV